MVYRPGPAPGLVYAGFWIRLVASMIDYIPLSILATLSRIAGVTATCASASGVSTCSYQVNATGLAITTAVLGVYWILTWSLLGASLGQRALGLRVVNAADGQRITIATAVARFFGYVVSAIPFAVGLIWAGFDHQKQGWHDKIAGTFVVRAV
ncbi:MAG: RDD family protein [Candidatus Dormibacter sp.]